MPLDLKALIKEVESIAQRAGHFIISQDINDVTVEEKSFNNFVSMVDKEAEKQIINELKALDSSIGFIAEESDFKIEKTGLKWIIDPLDGTTNYLYQIPFFCVSIALYEDGLPLIGVVYEPNRRECFSAYKGGGAFLNGHSINVSSKNKMNISLVATGFPYDNFERQESYMDLLSKVCKETRGLRRLGSAALDLVYVACGRFELFYEYGLNPWDVAAGALIVQEAGGKVSEFDGGDNPIFGNDIIASNSLIHNEFSETLKDCFEQ